MNLRMLIAVVAMLSSLASAGTGSDLLISARAAESEESFLKADSLYGLAWAALRAEGDHGNAFHSRIGSYRMQRMTAEYPLSGEEADSIFAATCPWLTDSERAVYFDDGRVDCMEFDGSLHYYERCIPNLLFRDLGLMRECGRLLDAGDPFYDGLEAIVKLPRDPGDGTPEWEPAIRPIVFTMESVLAIPRGLLPDTGTLRLWVPVPIQTGAQTDPRILSLEPEEFVLLPSRPDAVLGTIYLEVSLDSLPDDLTIELVTEHTHWERRDVVDHSLVGTYDRDDPEVVLYTASGEDIAVTDEIGSLALSIVAGEENPYLMAERIYRYVIENIAYSFVPHLSIAARGIPESVYCHENGYGDCGMQSMYFSALCRSVGIPARACGGMQLIPGIEGDHFWAEFLVPGYGWIPVDVTMAETADWSWRLTDEERETFREYFFGNLDPFRLVIQKDVRIPLFPSPGEPVAMPAAVQFPVAVSTGSIEDPNIICATHWEFSVTRIDR